AGTRSTARSCCGSFTAGVRLLHLHRTWCVRFGIRVRASDQIKADGIQMSRRILRGLIVVLALCSGFAAGEAVAQEAIGAVSRIQGEANGTRGTATQPLGPNA